jgi:hypothetical protein
VSLHGHEIMGDTDREAVHRPGRLDSVIVPR